MTNHNKEVIEVFHLLLLAWSEVILDVESFPDLLRSLSFYHVCNGLAGHVQ